MNDSSIDEKMNKEFHIPDENTLFEHLANRLFLLTKELVSKITEIN